MSRGPGQFERRLQELLDNPGNQMFYRKDLVERI
jgi:hypothetical protein